MKKINLMKENRQPAAAVKCLLALLICCCMLFSTVDFPAFAGVSEEVGSYSDGQGSQDEGFIEEIYEEIYEETIGAEEPAPASQETGDETDIVSVDAADSQAGPADENQPAAAAQESSQDESAGGQEDLSVSSAEEAAQNEESAPLPPPLFIQETDVDGVHFIISAEQDAILPGESFAIEWVTDEDLESCANEALSLEVMDDNTIIYHNVFQLSGASLNGKAHVRMQQLGFEDWANQFPGATLAVYVLSYHPDEDSAADRITVLENAYIQDRVAFDITGLGEYDVAAVLFLSAPEPVAEPAPETKDAAETVPGPEAIQDGSNEPDEFEDLSSEAGADDDPASAADPGAEDIIPVENVSEAESTVSASETEEVFEENQSAASAGDIDNSGESEMIEIIEEAGADNSEDAPAVEIIDDTVETGDTADVPAVEVINDTVETGDSEDTSAVEVINDTMETSDTADVPAVEAINDTVETGDSEDAPAVVVINDTVETGDSEDAPAVVVINDTVETGDSEDAPAAEEVIEAVESGDSEDAPAAEEIIEAVESGDSEDASDVEEIIEAVESGDSEDASDVEEVIEVIESGDSEDASDVGEVIEVIESGDSDGEATAIEEQVEILASEPENAPSFEIIKQPVNATGGIGDSIRFIVEAKGDGLSYQWQKRSGDDSPWKDIESSGNATFAGSLTPELSFTASKCTITKQYHCLVSQGEADDRETLTTQTVAVVSEEEAAANIPEEVIPAEDEQGEPAEDELEVKDGSDEDGTAEDTTTASEEETPAENEQNAPAEDETELKDETAETGTGEDTAIASEEETPAEDEQGEPDEDEPEDKEDQNENSDPEPPAETGDAAPEADAEAEPEDAEAEPVKDEEGQGEEETQPEAEDEQKPAEEDEEGQEPAEEEAAPVELPERKVGFEIEWMDETPVIGSVARFKAVLEGYDTLDYTLQWQYSEDNEDWLDLEGETNETMDVKVTLDNCDYYWRVMVKLTEKTEEE